MTLLPVQEVSHLHLAGAAGDLTPGKRSGFLALVKLSFYNIPGLCPRHCGVSL